MKASYVDVVAQQHCVSGSNYLAVDLVQGLGLSADLHLQLRGGFVDQVDGLVEATEPVCQEQKRCVILTGPQ